jgi:hypothetical protein
MAVALDLPLLPPRVRQRLLRREVNERIRELNASFGLANGSFELICECAHEDCIQRIKVHASLFERTRNEAGRFVSAAAFPFLVANGHELHEIQNVVEHHGDCLLLGSGQAGVAADAEKRESDDSEADGPPSQAKSDADLAKEREREMEESGEELPG